ncbi:MAG: hypothetical protein HC855_12455 [Rhizobiales bacterium]|nr:hypothetical protein [Hyphomicrobiales bacterium]
MRCQILMRQFPAAFDIDDGLARAIAAGYRPGETGIDAAGGRVEISLVDRKRIVGGIHERRRAAAFDFNRAQARHAPERRGEGGDILDLLALGAKKLSKLAGA